MNTSIWSSLGFALLCSGSLFACGDDSSALDGSVPMDVTAPSDGSVRDGSAVDAEPTNDATDSGEPIINEGTCLVSGDLAQWHRVVVECEGPDASEADASTFTDYRMVVTFTGDDESSAVPGHFAADGAAASSGATEGSVWRAYFMPPQTGRWSYAVSFRQGSEIAVSDDASAGTAVMDIDGSSGSFPVGPTTATGRDIRSRGLLRHVRGERYLSFAGTGEVFIEGGVDSPENLFGYADFDNTTKHSDVASCKGILHSFEPHLDDYRAGDPEWGDGRGHALMGLINYVASMGVNAIYLVPMSVQGDGCDAHPWTEYSGDRRAFDVSKLDQWELAFGHMTAQGLLIHYVTQENENNGLLGAALTFERRLYYRELISRFAHHPALQWNIGEENTNRIDAVKTFTDYIRAQDPYDHAILLHNYPAQMGRFPPMLGHESFDGPTLQLSDIPEDAVGGLYGEIRSWIDQSSATDSPWFVTATEASGAHAPTPDSEVTSRQRIYWMWASVMSGGAGFEWYLKNAGAGHAYDLAVENLHEFDAHWEQSGYLVSFFAETVNGASVDLRSLEPANDLTDSDSDWVLADSSSAYIIYLREGGTTRLSLADGNFSVRWMNPRTGVRSEGETVMGPGEVALTPPSENSQDWVVLVHR